MKPKLKVHDRVIAVDNGFALRLGDTGVVDSIQDNYVDVRLDHLGIVIGYPITSFKLLPAKK